MDKPNLGHVYYYYNDNGKLLNSIWNNCFEDKVRLLCGNFYDSTEEAEPYNDLIERIDNTINCTASPDNKYPIERSLEHSENIVDLLSMINEGCSYWIASISCIDNYPKDKTFSTVEEKWCAALQEGKSLEVLLWESSKDYTLDLKKLSSGFQKFIDIIKKTKIRKIESLDDMDSLDADAIMQYSLFDDIVYG